VADPVEVFRVTIPGEPVGAARPRFAKATGRTHKETKHRTWETRAIAAIRVAWVVGANGKLTERPPLDVGVELEVVSVHARPQAECRRKDSRGRTPMVRGKPDWDNIGKLASDALVQAGVLVDDTRVAVGIVRRFRCAILDNGSPAEGESVTIIVRRLT
jgi:Holliday junction resolvase RusA-like endonuclease